MDTSFFSYLQQLEMMAFFSGYPLLYAVILLLAGNRAAINKFASKIRPLLPYAYALVGTLYLGLQLKNLYPEYSLATIKHTVPIPLLMIWGLLSILFWIPVFSRKPVLSLLHSLVFFFYLAKDLFLHAFRRGTDQNVVKNDMKIVTDSLLLNLGAFLVILLVSFLVARFRKKKASTV